MTWERWSGQKGFKAIYKCPWKLVSWPCVIETASEMDYPAEKRLILRTWPIERVPEDLGLLSVDDSVTLCPWKTKLEDVTATLCEVA